jgi:predicted ester cyclase
MDTKQLAQAMFIDAFNDRSYKQKAKDLTDASAVIVDKPSGGQFKGPGGLVDFTEGFTNALPDLKGTLIEHKVNGNKVTTRIQGKGTFTGALQTPQGKVPGNGKKLDLEYQVNSEFNEAGKIVRAEFSYDMQAFAKQLGLG